MSAVAAAFPITKLLLFGLDDALSLELEQVLSGRFASLRLGELPEDFELCVSLLRDSGARAVFAWDAAPAIGHLMNASAAAGLPVIVVTRTPDSQRWLDAIEAGAADYAAPPFDPDQLGWMLRTNLRG